MVNGTSTPRHHPASMLLRRARLPLVLLVLLAGTSTLVRAQPAPPASETDAERATRMQELERLQGEKQSAATAESRLREEIETLKSDRKALQQAILDTAQKVRTVETKVSAIENRLGALDDNERRVRIALASRHGTISEVLAALQRLGRRPPPALLARPEDALEAVRSAILLGAVLPEIRVEAEALKADLTELTRVRREIAREREDMKREVAALDEERRRLERFVLERQKRQAEAESAADAERTRAAQLSRQVDSLKDLIARMEKEIGSVRAAAEAAAKLEATTTDRRKRLAALGDASRMQPAIPFLETKGSLPLPVNGLKIRDFGASESALGTERGISIATRPAAQVTAPADGWAVYAGPFRSFGQVLILNVGGGYHVLLAGMEKVSVDLGQFVLAGEPVGVMGQGPQGTSAIALGVTQPVLYIEFRKDGAPVDPSPWWAQGQSEKVRG